MNLAVHVFGEAGVGSPGRAPNHISRAETRRLLERLVLDLVQQPSRRSAGLTTERLVDDLYDGNLHSAGRVRRAASDLRALAAPFRVDDQPLVPRHARRGDQALYSLQLEPGDVIDVLEFRRFALDGLSRASRDPRSGIQQLQRALHEWPHADLLPFEQLSVDAVPGSDLAINVAATRAEMADLRAEVEEALGALASPPGGAAAESQRGGEFRLHTREWSPFLGRESEVQSLLAGWRERGSQQGMMTLVSGEPGVGKTRFCDELVRLVQPRRLWWGRCFPGHFSPELTFADALDQARQRPPAPTSPRSGTERNEALQHLASQARSLGREGGLAIVIDDFHDATPSTMSLVQHLASLALGGVLLMVTFRDTRPDFGPSVWADVERLRRLPRAVQVPLRGLTLAQADQLGADLAGGPARLERLIKACGGNPLLLGELVSEQGEQEEGSVYELEVPAGVAQHVQARIGALSDQQVTILEWAATIGLEFEVATLERATGADTDVVLQALDAGEEARLVTELGPGRYEFAHALIHAAILSRQSSSRLALRHHSLAEAMSTIPRTLVPDLQLRRANHYWAAARPGSGRVAARAHLEAAQSLRSQYLYEEAMATATRGRELLLADGDDIDPGLEAELWFVDIFVSFLIADHRRLTQAIDAAADAATRADSPVMFAQATYYRLTRNAELPYTAGVQEAGYEALRRMSRLGEDAAHESIRARVLSAMVTVASSLRPNEVKPSDRSMEDLADEAIARAERSGDREATAASLTAQYVSLWAPPDAEHQVKVASELTLSNERLGHRLRAPAHLMLGDRQRFERDIDRLEEIGRESREPRSTAHALQLRGVSALLDGNLSATLSFNEQATVLAGDQPGIVRSLMAQRFWLAYEGHGLGQEIDRIHDAINAHPGITATNALLALALVDLGDHDRARRAIRKLATNRFGDVARDHTFGSVLAGTAEAAIEVGDESLGPLVLELLEPWSGYIIIIGSVACALGAADRYLALLSHLCGHDDRAAELFGRAADLEAKTQSRPLQLRTDYWRMRLLGPSPSELRQVPEVIEQCQAQGLLGLARRYQSLLEARRPG